MYLQLGFIQRHLRVEDMDLAWVKTIEAVKGPTFTLHIRGLAN